MCKGVVGTQDYVIPSCVCVFVVCLLLVGRRPVESKKLQEGISCSQEVEQVTVMKGRRGERFACADRADRLLFACGITSG